MSVKHNITTRRHFRTFLDLNSTKLNETSCGSTEFANHYVLSWSLAAEIGTKSGNMRCWGTHVLLLFLVIVMVMCSNRLGFEKNDERDLCLWIYFPYQLGNQNFDVFLFPTLPISITQPISGANRYFLDFIWLQVYFIGLCRQHLI